MTMLDLVTPFTDFAFMRRALAACAILALSGTPLGVFMTLRRMTLVGDAVSHAILPGVAAAFLAFGLSLAPMTLGGIAAGLLFAGAALLLTRFTHLHEDAAFTLLYLIALAAGVTLVTLRGSNVDLLHLLFGNILALDTEALMLIAGIGGVTVVGLAVFYRPFLIGGFDPDFLRATHTPGDRTHGLTNAVFMALVMLNLVAAFQALGTLMALGLMLLPALAARFWTATIDGLLPLAVGLALLSAVAGLLLSYYGKVPTGPAIVLVAGGLALASALLGRLGSMRANKAAYSRSQRA
jgi:zinc/manganese transport system permease protein